jgi:hypothetical protein
MGIINSVCDRECCKKDCCNNDKETIKPEIPEVDLEQQDNPEFDNQIYMVHMQNISDIDEKEYVFSQILYEVFKHKNIKKDHLVYELKSKRLILVSLDDLTLKKLDVFLKLDQLSKSIDLNEMVELSKLDPKIFYS